MGLNPENHESIKLRRLLILHFETLADIADAKGEYMAEIKKDQEKLELSIEICFEELAGLNLDDTSEVHEKFNDDMSKLKARIANRAIH